MKQVNGVKYDEWWAVQSWQLPNSDALYYYKKRRLALPDDLKEKRAAHMKKMHSAGAPYAWIAKLYNLNRSQAYRIINNIPNN